jgi:hypothetical protein
MDGDLASEFSWCMKTQSINILFSATYTLIHAFLVKRAHVKAAQALKNSVEKRLVLKDHAIPKGPTLEDIIRLWKARRKEDQE